MRALADGDPRYAELNREFHFTVYEYAHSPLLLSLMRLLWASLHGGPRVSRTYAESARQHDEILAALAGRRRRRRLRSDISAHHGRGSGKRGIRVKAAAS